VKAADVAAIADGSGAYKGLVLLKADAEPILAALGLDRSSFGSRLTTVKSARALQQHLSAKRSSLGFLRADQVDPSVRALAWGNKSLFGNDRVKSLAKWPLTARLQAPEGAATAYDPGQAWTLAAGGDILLDRGVSLAINDAARGPDHPFDGGTVNITGRCKDCSPMGWDLPYTKKTGNAGIVRELLSEADLAIANFENPAPDDWRFHGSGMMFSANPKHIKGLVNAGLDWVSLANNHMGDSGDSGILETIKNLDKYGLAHGGAGANSKQARTATLLKAGGITVGILGYDSIAGYYRATATSPGTARLSAKALAKDIAAARKAGADLVIVFPHWGVEYKEKPSQYQVSMGRAAIDAGADMVIGNHPHWVEGMEVYKGKPIWYALGNFVFDQSWSEYTMEGITLELTLQGTELRQIRIRPHLIMGKAQPNLMDPATAGGKFVMDQFWRSSKGHLDW
jgi:poly-gamma-glutamate capsule biosynthesis protein CapA/YwtB (metallophosphatase superfamily)